MKGTKQEQWTVLQKMLEPGIDSWIDAFMIDCKTRNLAAGTIYFYRKKLQLFKSYCDSRGIITIENIDPTAIRNFLIELDETGHNPGGIHAVYRACKTFFRWYEIETEPDNWKDPFLKIKAPKIPNEPLRPAGIDTIKCLLGACDIDKFTGKRDRAIIYTLLDTGARAAEICGMDLEDIDLPKGSILIKQGKGRKPRMVFIGQTSRKAIRNYLRSRNDDSPALWVTDEGTRLKYFGLRMIIKRLSDKAGIKSPPLHSFRRQFALTMLREGVDIFSLQRLMGHSDIQVMRRYLAQTDSDGKKAHDIGSPVDKLKSG